MITITESALSRIDSLRKKLQMPYGYLKVGLDGGGCSGFIFSIEFTEKITEFDRMVIVDCDTEETVLIDKRSFFMLKDMEIDFEVGGEDGGFKFNVPDTKSCGCGKSFGET